MQLFMLIFILIITMLIFIITVFFYNSWSGSTKFIEPYVISFKIVKVEKLQWLNTKVDNLARNSLWNY
jgi:hypothetical protein